MRSIASYFLPEKIMKRAGSGGTFSAEYCYSVWLRHLVCLFQSGLLSDQNKLKKIAEIGPGDSLGVGIAALLSGVDEYFAFDVIEHANLERNKKIALQIASFFKETREIPHLGRSLENTKPLLTNYGFPSYAFKANLISEVDERLNFVIRALSGEKSPIRIEYVAPWYEKELPLKGKIDLVFSQAVMEHVDEYDDAYKKMYDWLKFGGIISHQIDYKAHEMTNEWNGHWFISKGTWKFLMKGRKYPINRLPHSGHIRSIEKAGFSIKNIIPFQQESPNKGLIPKVPDVTFEVNDFSISSALIQAVKESPASTTT